MKYTDSPLSLIRTDRNGMDIPNVTIRSAVVTVMAAITRCPNEDRAFSPTTLIKENQKEILIINGHILDLES